MTLPNPDRPRVDALLADSSRTYLALEKSLVDNVFATRDLLGPEKEAEYLKIVGRLRLPNPGPGIANPGAGPNAASAGGKKPGFERCGRGGSSGRRGRSGRKTRRNNRRDARHFSGLARAFEPLHCGPMRCSAAPEVPSFPGFTVPLASRTPSPCPESVCKRVRRQQQHHVPAARPRRHPSGGPADRG